MKPILEPSAQDFLKAHRGGGEFAAIADHLFDEINHIAADPSVDGEDKLLIELPFEALGLFHIYWGTKRLGRQYWYIYTPDYDEDVVRVHNIGFVGTEKPFLSRREAAYHCRPADQREQCPAKRRSSSHLLSCPR